MNPKLSHARAITRRAFFSQAGLSLGAIALGSLLDADGFAAAASLSARKGVPGRTAAPGPLAPKKPPFAAKAKAVIYLDMSGAPPTLDLFDYKPKLVELNMQPCPEELLKGQRFAFI